MSFLTSLTSSSLPFKSSFALPLPFLFHASPSRNDLPELFTNLADFIGIRRLSWQIFSRCFFVSFGFSQILKEFNIGQLAGVVRHPRQHRDCDPPPLDTGQESLPFLPKCFLDMLT